MRRACRDVARAQNALPRLQTVSRFDPCSSLQMQLPLFSKSWCAATKAPVPVDPLQKLLRHIDFSSQLKNTAGPLMAAQPNSYGLETLRPVR